MTPMFTGIIETLGTLTDLRDEGTNRHFTVSSDIASASRWTRAWPTTAFA